jgi:hypothetical protein
MILKYDVSNYLNLHLNYPFVMMKHSLQQAPNFLSKLLLQAITQNNQNFLHQNYRHMILQKP